MYLHLNELWQCLFNCNWNVVVVPSMVPLKLNKSLPLTNCWHRCCQKQHTFHTLKFWLCQGETIKWDRVNLIKKYFENLICLYKSTGTNDTTFQHKQLYIDCCANLNMNGYDLGQGSAMILINITFDEMKATGPWTQ